MISIWHKNAAWHHTYLISPICRVYNNFARELDLEEKLQKLANRKKLYKRCIYVLVSTLIDFIFFAE